MVDISILFILSVIIFIVVMVLTHPPDRGTKKLVKRCQKRIEMLRKNKEIGDDLKYFPMYYINLDRSKERREVFEAGMEYYDIKNYKRVSAFDGQDIKNLYEGDTDGYVYQNMDGNCTPQELAITMSHIRAISEAKKDGHHMAMIMEDDCDFVLAPYWPKSISQIIDEIPDDCEILLLANRYDEKQKEFKLMKDNSSKAGVCYIVTQKGMEKISQYLDGHMFTFTVEDVIFDNGFLTNFEIYTYNISLFLLDNFKHVSTHYTDGEKLLARLDTSSIRMLENESYIVG